jgi:hypothetical protein
MKTIKKFGSSLLFMLVFISQVQAGILDEGCSKWVYDSSNGLGGLIMVTCENTAGRYDIGQVWKRKLKKRLKKKCESLNGSSLTNLDYKHCRHDKRCGRLKAKCK